METDIGLLLREQRHKDYEETEKEINLYRSGSAPPTIEGSLSAAGGLVDHRSGSSGFLFRGEFDRNKTSNVISSEEDVDFDPSYLSYYYSNRNLNPRLPPSILSRADWRSEQNFQGGSSKVGENGDRRKLSRNDCESSSGKLKSVVEWGCDEMIGMPGLDLRNKHKNLDEKFQNSSKAQHVDSLISYGPTGESVSLVSAFSGMNLSEGGGSLLLPHQHPDVANSSFPKYGLSGSYMNSPMPSLMSAGHVSNYIAGNNALQPPFMDPMYIQFLRALEDLSVNRNYMANSSYMDFLQKAFINNKSVGLGHHGYYGNHPAFVVPWANNPVNPHSLVVGPSSPTRHGEFGMCYPVGPGYAPSLLEEFKANKTRCFRLSEIAGHVVEFSQDQYGSRFIQQKLETAKTEEKEMVLKEIIPHAITLMTDVFGNYVVQKFFESGVPSQRRELAEKIRGHVLKLSFQMYGCRVIQKVIEVVDLEQKVKMIQELGGHIIRCIRDQNANHVVQKCIECVPEEHIQFIFSSFCNQVVSLSKHPYGCRVIQRVLERCMDPQTQKMVMDEILGSISSLAQDQYGNYVVQHVLEHGLPHERSFIIQELAGNIVKMSQQKFASNVVEKCLAFGNPTDRQILVNEMLGSTNENEPLQSMMKDQFGNYVVQKVIETCSDEQRELILSRIKVHLDALKKYTYGKHIVGRVEQLIDAGERRSAARIPNIPALEAEEKDG